MLKPSGISGGENVVTRDGAPSISDILAGFGQGKSRTYEIDVPNGILKSNDAADHARAMEALDRLEKLRGLQPRNGLGWVEPMMAYLDVTICQSTFEAANFTQENAPLDFACGAWAFRIYGNT